MLLQSNISQSSRSTTLTGYDNPTLSLSDETPVPSGNLVRLQNVNGSVVHSSSKRLKKPSDQHLANNLSVSTTSEQPGLSFISVDAFYGSFFADQALAHNAFLDENFGQQVWMADQSEARVPSQPPEPCLEPDSQSAASEDAAKGGTLAITREQAGFYDTQNHSVASHLSSSKADKVGTITHTINVDIHKPPSYDAGQPVSVNEDASGDDSLPDFNKFTPSPSHVINLHPPNSFVSAEGYVNKGYEESAQL